MVDDICNRLLALPAEQEAGMKDDHVGAGCLREAGGVIEHAERHLEFLLALDVPHEGGERCVHREHDVLGAQRLAERRGGVIVEPEAAGEPDLACPVAPRGEEGCGLLEGGRIRQARGPEADLSHGCEE